MEKFKDILKGRLEKYNETYNWYELHRAREKRIFENEKIINPYRASSNNFAYSNKEFYGSTDIYFITRKEEVKESLKYINALLISNTILDWLNNNCKKKGESFEFFSTPLSNIPIRKIDFTNEDEAAIHTILGGIYSSVPTDDENFLFDEITQTYIKQKGLADLYIKLKTELHKLKIAGFEFEPESVIYDASAIKSNIFSLTNYLCEKNIVEINYVREVMLFYPSLLNDPTLYSFNSVEKEEVKGLLKGCTYFIKAPTRDIIFKNVKSDRLNSLFNDSGGFETYGFEDSFDLITTDNRPIEVACKTSADAAYLVELILQYLKRSKTLSFETLLSFPITNKSIQEFIQDKQLFIFESLSPLNDKLEKRLKEIFEKREIEPLNKINNLHCLQYLINRYVNFLYKGILDETI